MMVFSVDQHESPGSKDQSTNSQTLQTPRIVQSNKYCSKCLFTFLILSIGFIVLCCVLMAIMTTSVFIKTSDLNEVYSKNKELEFLLTNNNSDVLNDPNKLERNVLGWLQNKIRKSFFKNKDNNYNTPNQYMSNSRPQMPECGIPGIQPRILNTRIMNGKEALPNSWPWAVSIGLEGPRDKVPHACGGTLINKRTVITAAHCVIRNSIFTLVGSPAPYTKYNSIEKMLRIYIGLHDRNDINEKNVYSVESIIMHERFDPITFKNDVAIIRLDRDVQSSYEIGFACLGKLNQVQPGDTVYAIGWGYTEMSRNQASRYLMQVDLTVQKKENCLIQYVDIDQFCAGNIFLKKDTCNGDSGGPILKYINNRWTLVGIVSNGDVSCGGTGIYINVAFFYDWILRNSRV
ncbi:unnamed protein product [Brachionus calyciflorus]|uniref:Peptidase S1 domain-containing protein n=1 Tax=Brachionus calyciflorus TaxID=104777 RepID=A0A814DVP5_9BILA|nr:unnamed protein product [Brachionus calyciflorus]